MADSDPKITYNPPVTSSYAEQEALPSGVPASHPHPDGSSWAEYQSHLTPLPDHGRE